MRSEELQSGHIISKIMYAKVKDVHTEDKRGYYDQRVASLIDLDDGKEFYIYGEELLDTCLSADHYSETEEVTLTELAEKFVSLGTRPFTVVFIKQNGEERLLRGRLLSSESHLGRSMVFDFDVEVVKPAESPIRQVDHRTLQSLIVSDTKYVLKGKKNGKSPKTPHNTLSSKPVGLPKGREVTRERA